MNFWILLHIRDKKIAACFFAGFTIIFLGLSVTMLSFISDSVNAPPWNSIILIPIRIIIWICGYKNSNKNKILLKKFEDFIKLYIKKDLDWILMQGKNNSKLITIDNNI